jgi:hypothetical protein
MKSNAWCDGRRRTGTRGFSRTKLPGAGTRLNFRR